MSMQSQIAAELRRLADEIEESETVAGFAAIAVGDGEYIARFSGDHIALIGALSLIRDAIVDGLCEVDDDPDDSVTASVLRLLPS